MRTIFFLLFTFHLLPVGAEQTIFLTALNQSGQQQRAAELLRYYRAKALEGDAHAQFKLGFAYETGDGIAADGDKAVRWYRRAARQGHRNAIMNLAAMDEKDRPFVDPESEHEKKLKTDATAGNVEARNQLGRMLVNNVLTNPDYRQIYVWMKELALAGDRDSQFILAQMNEIGIAVPQNYINAYVWYSVAAASGDELALLSRDSIATRMSQQQLEKGQGKAAEFFENYVLNQQIELDESGAVEVERPSPVISLPEDKVISQLP